MSRLYWGDMTPERIAARTRKLEQWQESRSSTSKPGGTTTVAASNTVDWRGCDQRCDGTNDEVQIQAAIDAVSSASKSLLLLEGDYWLDGNIISYVEGFILRGSGWGTVLHIRTPATANPIGFAANYSLITDLKIVVEAGAGGAGTRPNGLTFGNYTLVSAERIWVVGDETVADDGSDFRQNGIFHQGRHGHIKDCYIRTGMRHGILLYSLDITPTPHLSGNFIYAVNGNGIFVFRSVKARILDNYTQAAGGDGIRLEGDATYNADYNVLTGNVSKDNTGYGVNIIGGANANSNQVLGGSTRDNVAGPINDAGTATRIWAVDGYGDGPLTAAWDAGAYEIRAQTFQSDVATGTAPLTVASTTKVTNLGADTLDTFHAATAAAVSTIPVQDASGDVAIERNFSPKGYIYPGTGSAAQATMYIRSDGDSLFVNILTAGQGIKVINSGAMVQGATIFLRHTSASPAAADECGRFAFQGYNDNVAPETITYGELYVTSADISDGTEDGNLYIDLMAAGATNAPAAYVDSTGQIYADLGAGTGHVTIFDEHDDAMVLFQASHNQIKVLEDLGVAKYHPDHKGGWMLNLTRMAWLLAGGIYQTRAKVDAQEARLAALERRQNMLPAGGAA